MIKAIFFDLFGVLVTEGFKQFCDTYFPGDIQKRRKAIELVTNHDAGYISHEQYVKEIAKLAGVSESTVGEHMDNNQPNQLLIDYIRKELKPKYKNRGDFEFWR